MSKFIDLADEIMAEVPNDLDPLAVRTLRWLDEHPERVPGLTITAGEVGQWSHLIRGDVEAPSIIDFLESFGITVVPDPEPTNAEELTWALMRVVEKHGRGITVENQSDAKAVAELLDADGVRAPGDDDE